MIIDSYYKMQPCINCKSKTRFDVITFFGNYEPFESLRNQKQELFFYYTDIPKHFNTKGHRKSFKSLTNRHGRNISSLYFPDVTVQYAYGDIVGTHDALLIIIHEDSIELLICKGQKINSTSLYNLLLDGELKKEIENLRQFAKSLL
jgi:hypothetical protein